MGKEVDFNKLTDRVGNCMAKTENKGYLKTWKDDRGFGFIKPESGGQDIFIHISALKGTARRPVKGDTIFYRMMQDANGKYRAGNARIEGVEIIPDKKQPVKKIWLWLVAALLGLVSVAVAACMALY